MVGGGVAIGLAGLGHHVAHVDAPGARAADGPGDAGHEQVGDDAGVEAPRAQDDEVGAVEGLDGLVEGLDPLVGEEDAAERGFAEPADVDLGAHDRAVDELGAQVGVGERGGQHAPLDGQHAADLAHRLLEAARDLGERGDEQVAEAHALERAVLEAVLEEAVEEALGVAERDQAVADVAGRQDAEVGAEAARAAAVVGDGDDSGELAAEGLEPFEHDGQPCAAADGDDPRRAAMGPMEEHVDDVEHLAGALDTVVGLLELAARLERAVAAVEHLARDDAEGVGGLDLVVDAVADGEHLVGLEVVLAQELLEALLEQHAALDVVDDDGVAQPLEAEDLDLALLAAMDAVGDDEDADAAAAQLVEGGHDVAEELDVVDLVAVVGLHGAAHGVGAEAVEVGEPLEHPAARPELGLELELLAVGLARGARQPRLDHGLRRAQPRGLDEQAGAVVEGVVEVEDDGSDRHD